MTSRQNWIIRALALANVVFLVLVAVVLLRRPTWAVVKMPTAAPTMETVEQVGEERWHTDVARDSRSSPIDTVVPLTVTSSAQDQCQWKAVHYLAERQLAGTVDFLPDGTLQFVISWPLNSDRTVDDAGQVAWSAFDIALALYEDPDCPSYSQIAIDINAYTQTERTSIVVSVDAVTLSAFKAGDLTEEEFVDLVSYDVRSEAGSSESP
jgi:hypothetical protein